MLSTVTRCALRVQLYRLPMPGVPEAFDSTAAGACVPCSGRRPLVHSGFVESYESSGIKRKILQLVMSLFASGEVVKAETRVFTTGHSLGGALASLCSGASSAVCVASCFEAASRTRDGCPWPRGACAALVRPALRQRCALMHVLATGNSSACCKAAHCAMQTAALRAHVSACVIRSCLT